MLDSKRLIVLGLLFLSICARSQQTNEQYNLAVKYLLALPEEYSADTAKKWPLLIFLHGSGESGDDLNKVKVHGPPKLVEQGRKLPFIVVSPQANRNFGWQPEILEHFLRSLKQTYRVDKDRIYLTGLSMGGYGTWNWASKYPKNFAAIVPICGGGDTAEVWKLQNVPVWCFHGGKDNVVPPSESTRLIDALKKVNPAARLTIYPDAGHDSWTETYNNDSVYSWLLQQKRKVLEPVAMTASKLKEYAGLYSRTGKDTLKLEIAGNKLIAKTGGPELEVFSSGKDSFFINEGDQQFEIRYTRNSKGEIDKFVFYGDRQMEFKKLKEK
jgi:predicted esterase